MSSNVLNENGVNKTVSNKAVERLAGNAANIVAMLEHTCPDKLVRLKLASALAGHACHRAVIANDEKFVNVKTDDGLIFYFGDAVDSYLMEGPFSILSFMKGYYIEKATEQKELDIDTPIKKAASDVGNREYLIWGHQTPAEVYGQVRDCWNGIYENMTSKYCESPSEWPVLYGIVLQNIMLQSDLDAEETFFKALEGVMFISKMDDSSVNEKELDNRNSFLYNFYKDGKLVEISDEDKTFLRKSFGSLKSFFDGNKIPYEIVTSGNEAKIFTFKMLIREQPVKVYVALYLQPKMCRIEFKLPFIVSADKVNDLCTALVKYNYGRRFGAFQYDESDGDLNYRDAFPCLEGMHLQDFLAAFLPSMNSVSKFMDDLKKFV